MLGTPSAPYLPLGTTGPLGGMRASDEGVFTKQEQAPAPDATIQEQKQPPRNEMREGEAFQSAILSPCPGTLLPTLVKRNDF